MRIESFLKAESDIRDYFAKNNFLVYTRNDLIDIFNQQRDFWEIASYRNYKHFLSFLDEKQILIKEKLVNIHNGAIKYLWNKFNVTNFDKAIAIKKDGYLSNFSAMQIHGITLQIPKTIFVSFDQYAISYNHEITLEQEDVNR